MVFEVMREEGRGGGRVALGVTKERVIWWTAKFTNRGRWKRAGVGRVRGELWTFLGISGCERRFQSERGKGGRN